MLLATVCTQAIVVNYKRLTEGSSLIKGSTGPCNIRRLTGVLHREVSLIIFILLYKGHGAENVQKVFGVIVSYNIISNLSSCTIAECAFHFFRT